MPEYKISLYKRRRPTRMRAYFGAGSWLSGSWRRKMRIGPTRYATGSQFAAFVAKNCTAFDNIRCVSRAGDVLNYAQLRRPQSNHGSAYAEATADKFYGCHGWVGRVTPVRAVSLFSNRQSAISQLSLPFPPNNFPGRSRSCGTARTNQPVLDGHGNGLPRQQSNKQLERSNKQPK